MQPNGEWEGVDQNQLKCKKKSFKPGKFYSDWNIPHIFKGRFLSFMENNIENRSVPCNMYLVTVTLMKNRNTFGSPQTHSIDEFETLHIKRKQRPH